MKPTSTNRNLSYCAWVMSVVALACLFVPAAFRCSAIHRQRLRLLRGIPVADKNL